MPSIYYKYHIQCRVAIYNTTVGYKMIGYPPVDMNVQKMQKDLYGPQFQNKSYNGKTCKYSGCGPIREAYNSKRAHKMTRWVDHSLKLKICT